MEILNKYIKVKAEVLSTGKKNPNEIFLFNSTTNRGFLVEGIASYVCKKMNGEKKFSEILLEFELEYKVSAKKFEVDIQNFLNDLVKNDLVIIDDSPILQKED